MDSNDKFITWFMEKINCFMCHFTFFITRTHHWILTVLLSNIFHNEVLALVSATLKSSRYCCKKNTYFDRYDQNEFIKRFKNLWALRNFYIHMIHYYMWFIHLKWVHIYDIDWFIFWLLVIFAKLIYILWLYLVS